MGHRDAVRVLRLAGALLVPKVPGGAPWAKSVAARHGQRHKTPAGILERPSAPPSQISPAFVIGAAI